MAATLQVSLAETQGWHAQFNHSPLLLSDQVSRETEVPVFY